MPQVRAGEVYLGWCAWGEGDVTVVFLHGNLACKEWIEFAVPLLPSGIRVIGIDWRCCGESDRPAGRAGLRQLFDAAARAGHAGGA